MNEGKSNIETALEAISKKMAEMEGRLLPADVAKRLLDKESEAEAKAAQDEAVQKRAEELVRAKAKKDPAQVVTGEEAVRVGRTYGYLQARRDFAKGRTSPTPVWDEETEDRFSEYMIAVKDGDKAKIGRMVREKANAPYTATTTAGGYLIPDEFRSELIRAAYSKSLALQLCRIIPMASDQLYLPSVTAGITAVWGTINTATGDTKATLGQISLAAEKLVAVSYVPNELVEDAFLGVGGFVADEFTSAFAQRIDHEAWTADASDAADVFEGWGRAATTNRAGSGVSGDSANGSIQTDHILEVIGKLSDTAVVGAVFIMAPTVWARVRALADSNSNLLVNIDQNYRYNLFGFPVYLTSQMTAKSSVAAGDELMLFGNPKNYIIGDRRSLTIASSPHIAFTADQTVYMATQRLAMSIGIETELAVLSRSAANGTLGPAA